MIEELTYRHFCDLGALLNRHCFTRWDTKSQRMQYFYAGDLSQACYGTEDRDGASNP